MIEAHELTARVETDGDVAIKIFSLKQLGQQSSVLIKTNQAATDLNLAETERHSC